MTHYYLQQKTDRRRQWLLTAAIVLGLMVALVLLIYTPSSSAAPAGAAVSGTVFDDANYNGTNDGESGVPGVVVTAYDRDGVQQGTDTTDGAGAYSFSASGTGPYRLEFSSLPGGYVPSVVGADNETSVVIVPEGGATVVDFAIIDPGAFHDADLWFATSQHTNGIYTANSSGQPGTKPALRSWPVTRSGNSLAAGIDASFNELGATWGLAYDPNQRVLFIAAMLKRHTSYGPLGGGGIYKVDYSDPNNPVISSWQDLDGDPITAGGTVDTGTITNAARSANLATTASGYSQDLTAVFDQVGKESLGDIDLTRDGKTLYVMNLYQRTLLEITTATGVVENAYAMPTPAGCTSGEVRPWAVKVGDADSDGTEEVYIGLVCSGEADGTLNGAHVYQLVAGSFTPEFSLSLAYQKGTAWASLSHDARNWEEWIDATSDIPGSHIFTNDYNGSFGLQETAVTQHPQPILADLEIATDGSMVLSFMDRLGHQMGVRQPDENGNFIDDIGTTGQCSTTGDGTLCEFYAQAVGDIVKACVEGSLGTWIAEGESGSNCPQPHAFNGDRDGDGNNGELDQDSNPNDASPGDTGYYSGVEFFDDGVYNQLNSSAYIHGDSGAGGLANMPGALEIVQVVLDPYTINTGGTKRYNNDETDTTGTQRGDWINGYQIYQYPNDAGSFAKAHGLGDLEVLEFYVPVEIGNRVWEDSNNNGVQDPGEPGISGVVVGLYECDGTFMASATTASNGSYLFSSDAAGSSTASEIYGVNLRVDDCFTVALLDSNFASGGVLFFYQTASANEQDANGTTTDASGNDPVLDNRDSDGVSADCGGGVGSGANEATNDCVDVNTGTEGGANHTLDFGAVPLDLGDLNENDGYKTTLANSGAAHVLANDTFLGACVDYDGDGQPDPGSQAGSTGNGDDGSQTYSGGPARGTCSGDDDEDGVTFVVDASAACLNITVNVTGFVFTGGAAGVLNAWIDWDGDGSFNDTVFGVPEHIVQDNTVPDSVTLGAGQQVLSFPATGSGVLESFTMNVPCDESIYGSNVGVRFRFTEGDVSGNDSPTGTVSNGEVEDYRQQLPTPTALALTDFAAARPSSPGVLPLMAVAVLLLLASMVPVFLQKRRNA